MKHYFRETPEEHKKHIIQVTCLDKKAKTFVHVWHDMSNDYHVISKGKYVVEHIWRSAVDGLASLVTDKPLLIYLFETYTNANCCVLHYKGYSRKITKQAFEKIRRGCREQRKTVKK